MIYTRPYMTKKFIAYAGDSRTADVALAVRVMDAFTEEPARVPLNVGLKELPRLRPIRGESDKVFHDQCGFRSHRAHLSSP